MRISGSIRGPRHGAASWPARAHRGFMSMLVLTSFVFLVAAVVAMTTLFTHEVRRTRAALAETQLRQLLLAATPTAEAELKANPAPHDLDLATPVKGATVRLHITAVAVEVHADYRGYQIAQTLTFTNGKLTSVALNQTSF